MLYFVATPIGNLQDITLRALETLKSVDKIYCEDTRHARKLLDHYGVKAKMGSYHEHNAEETRPAIIQELTDGRNIAIISDAGMPGISDPGFKLVEACQMHDLKYTIIPGASSIITALVGSGMATDRFLFIGFPPNKHGARHKFLQEISSIKSSIIMLESPRRLLVTLNAMQDIFGNIEVSVCRELTKLFEEFRKGSIADLIHHYNAHPPKGEIVIVFENNPSLEDMPIEELLREALLTKSTKDAVSYVAQITGKNRREIYDQAIKIKEQI